MPVQLRPKTEVPPPPFFQTAEQRTALARKMFFDDGVRPSGLVSEPVIQSWMRCTSRRRNTNERLAFNPVTSSRLNATLERNRELLEAARHEIGRMEASLTGTDCRVLLSDAQGVIVHATQIPHVTQQPILRIASRVGVDVTEDLVGTTAPGIVMSTGKSVTVTGAEHFHDCLASFECAAAPIRDVHGNLAAVLDLSIESRRFGFDAACVVGMYATSIENRLLQAQSRDHLVVHFQAAPAMIDTPMEALAGVAADGTIAWINAIAARLLGPSVGECVSRDTEMALGVSQTKLLAWMRDGQTHAVTLPSGLGVWVRVAMHADDGGTSRGTVIPPTLGDHSRNLIERTLNACGGNVARTARMLGVSRGMVYRRMRGK